jgi:large subunit ribosomal protein L7/L12
MSNTPGYRSLESEVGRLEGQWPKKSSGDYSLQQCLIDFKEGLQPDEQLLGWINANSFSFSRSSLIPSALQPPCLSSLLLLTDKRLVIVVQHIVRIEIKSLPLESITSVDVNKGTFWGNGIGGVKIQEVARTTSLASLTPEFAEKFLATLNNALAAAKAKNTTPPPTPSAAPDPITQLERLAELKAKGILTEEEFVVEKRRVLGASNTPASQGRQPMGAEYEAPPIIGNQSVPTPPPLFDVVLDAVPADKKIAVIMAIREIKAGLGLAEAKLLVETLPSTLLTGVTNSDANNAKQKLEKAGASALLRQT